jgi:hypothetical protein
VYPRRDEGSMAWGIRVGIFTRQISVTGPCAKENLRLASAFAYFYRRNWVRNRNTIILCDAPMEM